MAFTVAELRAVFSSDTKGLQSGMRQVDSSIKRTDGFIRQAGATMAGFLGAQVVQQGARAISAGFGFIKDAAVGFNDQMDRSTTGFTTMLGSGKAARRFLDDLKSFAVATPFEFSELVQNAQKLMAMGFAAKDVLPTLTAVGDATAGLGGDPAVMSQIIRAMGQMQAKGKVMTGEMTQLAEAGVGSWQMLADEIGVSVPKAMELVEKGQVKASQALPALVAGMNSQFGGLMDAQTKTWTGAMSNIKDVALQVIAGVLRPQFEKARDVAVDFAAWLGEGHIERYLSMIGDALAGETASTAIDGIRDAATNLYDAARPVAETLLPLLLDGARELGDFLISDLIPAVADVAGFFADHESATWLLIGAITALVAITKIHAAVLAVAAAGGLAAWLKQTKLITSATKTYTAVQWALNAAHLANPIGAVILLIAGLVAGLVIAYKKSETFRNIVDGALRAVGDAAKWLWENAAKPMIDGMVKGFKVLGDIALWLWNNAFQPMITKIIGGVARLMDMWAWMLRGLSKVPGFDWAKGAANAMAGAADRARALAGDIRRIPNSHHTRITGDASHARLAIRYTAIELRNLQALAAQGIRVAGVTGYGGFTARALGGPVLAGNPYLVGERGMELFVPNTSGRIISNDDLTSVNGRVMGWDGASATSDPELLRLLEKLDDRLAHLDRAVAAGAQAGTRAGMGDRDSRGYQARGF